MQPLQHEPALILRRVVPACRWLMISKKKTLTPEPSLWSVLPSTRPFEHQNVHCTPGMKPIYSLAGLLMPSIQVEREREIITDRELSQAEASVKGTSNRQSSHRPILERQAP
jgi:hypothetical protein